MKAADKKAWVAALRSGKYKQTRNKLYDTNTDSYCCLGVACAVFGTEDKEWNEPHRGTLPLDLCERLNVDRRCTIPSKKKGKRITLIELNDASVSFAKLADIIEKYF